MINFIVKSNSIQTKQINDLLGLDYESYEIGDIFNRLPYKIEYNNEIGYMRMSKIDIVYSSLETEMKGHVVLMFQYIQGRENIFDSFIKALIWFKDHKNEYKNLDI